MMVQKKQLQSPPKNLETATHNDCSVVNSTKPPSKKPNRRRRRKSIKEKSETNLQKPVIKFTIDPIIKPSNGYVVRPKSDAKTTPRKIKIYQHVPNGSNFYTFESKEYKNDKITDVDKPVEKTSPNKIKEKETMKKAQVFQPYISRAEALEGIKNGTLYEGVIRINPNNYTDAFCPNADRTQVDYYFNGIVARNRALEGDVVAIRVRPESEWGDKKKLSDVVHILDYVHTRVAAGYISVVYHNRKPVPVFQPRDKRFPRMNLVKNVPANLIPQPKLYESTLFIAKLTDWKNPNYGLGQIVELLGESSDLKAENRAILIENNIRYESFPPEALEFIPDFTLTESDYKNRLDLRRECIFTIDPLTARDLDDAVHIKQLPNGCFEVGVHIADVTHYLPENTLLDEIVAKKATTTYLVDNVFHMLPKQMCMACSLLPGKDCAAFSVIWEMTEDGTVLNTKYARTIINNCTQLAYEHAQWMIMNPDEESIQCDLPPIVGYTPNDIRKRVTMLHNMARQMRQRRYDNGAMQISQIKLGFHLDSDGEPVEFFAQKTKEANHLIEEFMLQANISVAEKIYSAFPEEAFLRNHESANPRMISMVRDKLEILGIHINIESSASIFQSIAQFSSSTEQGLHEYANYVAINHMLAKPMIRARYFCAKNHTYGDFHHYALSIPIYTHFTSPIRRYADVMVHRLLAAALGYRDKPNLSTDLIQKIADNCNEQKFNAKKAGDASCELLLARFVETHQPFNAEAVVVNVSDKIFEVVVLSTGSVIGVFTEELYGSDKVEVQLIESPENIVMKKLIIYYPELGDLPACQQTIELFQVITLSLYRKPKSIKLRGLMRRPNQGN